MSYHVYQSQIEHEGFGVAPNGASYRVVKYKDGFAVERAIGESRETIVTDYRGRLFDLTAAREFARFVIAPGAPISARAEVRS